MKILVACEESQAVTIEFRKLGHEAYSCDIEPCSGGHPEWHLQTDVTLLLQEHWDMIIAFPPCTYLTYAGTRSWNYPGRDKKRKDAAEFFMMFANHPCNKIAIENPVGYMNTIYREPDQIIHPYYFGDEVHKRTCIWLKGLPPLKYDYINIKKPDPIKVRHYDNRPDKLVNWCESVSAANQKERAKLRSKTFPGIAKAMAEQWSYPGEYYEFQQFELPFYEAK